MLVRLAVACVVLLFVVKEGHLVGIVSWRLRLVLVLIAVERKAFLRDHTAAHGDMLAQRDHMRVHSDQGVCNLANSIDLRSEHLLFNLLSRRPLARCHTLVDALLR